MASISRTAYPRFKNHWTEEDLEHFFDPSEEELNFVDHPNRGVRQQLTLLILLKVHQYLGRTCPMHKVPRSLRQFISAKLGLSEDITPLEETEDNKKNFYRYRQLIRRFLNIRPWSDDGESIVAAAVDKAAYAMSDPSDLVNVAIETLVAHRYELPAFSTLDRLTGHIRQQVHETLYLQMTADLTQSQRQTLNALLEVREDEWKSDFTRIKEYPRGNSLKNMREWVDRLDWLSSIIQPASFIEGVAHTKIRQFAAQTQQMELGDMKDISRDEKRQALLLCFIHEAQVKTRDELINMFLRRMRSTHNRARDKMQAFHDLYRSIEEQMLAAFAQVVDYAAQPGRDAQLGRQVRQVLDDNGGAELLQQQYRQVSAYHNKNYLPLLWPTHRQHRAAIFRLLNLMDIEAATQDDELLQAWHFVSEHRHARRDYLPYDIDLDFLSQRWKA